MKILVTGGSGFIGTNLIQMLLGKGHQLVSVDIVPPKVTDYQSITKVIDLCDSAKLRDCFRKYKPEYVIHLAARTDLNEKIDINGYAANIEGVRNLAHAVKDCGSVKRCIYTSTQLVCRVGYVPEHDTDYCPNTLYGESKMRGERIVKELDGGGADWCIIRPTTVWGPWMKPYQERFVELIRRGLYFHIGYSGRFKSYGYVGNFCRQVCGLLEAERHLIHRKTFYLADYEPLSLRKWADSFQKEFGSRKIRTFPMIVALAGAKVGDLFVLLGVKNFPLTSFRLRNISTEYIFNLDPIKEVVPTLPYSMETAVHETVEWLKLHRNLT